MFKTLKKTFNPDNDFPERTARILALKRVIDGKLYDELKYPFYQEREGDSPQDKYIKLNERRPSVRTNLCRTVVDDSVALLFAEGHFPTFEFKDAEKKDRFKQLIKETKLNQVMIEAATTGSTGSVAILFRVLNKRVFLNVLDTAYLTPKWKSDEPDVLEKVTEKYKVKGKDLLANGYTIKQDDLSSTFWFQREWDGTSETWYVPWKISDEEKKLIDSERTVTHDLGFVPVIWIKNLPGGDVIDGMPTFPDEAIDTQIEIDYQLSQAGRGLKYTSDPTLMLKDPPSDENGNIVKGAANALIVGQDGDAKLLEINGTGCAAVLDYVKHLREIALETMHGNRISTEKIATAQSGRAIELMNQSLIWLADRLRISYGEGALMELYRMVAKASIKFTLQFKGGKPLGKFNPEDQVSLRWPAWCAPTLADLQTMATTLRTLCDANLMSRETAIRILSTSYDISDAEAEKKLADADMDVRNADAKINATIQE